MSRANGGAVVTGAASGIGLELARMLSSRGYAICAIDKYWPSKILEEFEAVQKANPSTRLHTLDVRNHQSLRNTIEAFSHAVGGLRLCFPNAGIGPLLQEVPSLERAHEFMDVNYFGAIATIEPTLEVMLASGGGRIVISGSISSLVATHSSGAYSASKAALRLWTQGKQLGLRGSSVTISTAILGFVDTPMTFGMRHAEGRRISTTRAAREILSLAESGRHEALIPLAGGLPWLTLSYAGVFVRTRALSLAKRHYDQIEEQ